MAASGEVKIGRWYDYSYSHPFGDTLTLQTREGNLLIAATSLFVTVVGIRLWSMIAFTIHQRRSQPGMADALFRQQQIMLRNSSGPFGTFLNAIQLGWAWRKKDAHGRRVPHLVQRTLVLAIPALLYTSIFVISGIMVSRVARGQNVLLINGICGVWNGDEGLDMVFERAMFDMQEARAYASQCYRDRDNAQGCDFFPVEALPYSPSEVDCPFETNEDGLSLCTVPALQLDTGMLDSDTHLGINAPAEERLLFQRRSICSPLNTTGYSRMSDDDESLDFFFGPFAGDPETFTYNTNMMLGGAGLQLDTVEVFNDGNEFPGAWRPIEPLNRTDATVALIFLMQNSVSWVSPVLDPWYHATYEIDAEYGGGYAHDSLVNVMGCAEQARICNPSNSRCSEFVSPYMFTDRSMFRSLEMNSAQEAVGFKLMMAALDFGISGVPYRLNTNALYAQNKIASLTSGSSLPDNQWKIEMELWYQTSLSLIQGTMIRFASNEPSVLDNPEMGFSLFDMDQFGENSYGPGLIDQCSQTRVRSARDHQNFSFVGLGLVFSIGIVVIITSYSLEHLVAARRKRWGTKHDYRELARLEERLFNLFARAHQHAGFEGWQNLDADFPITAADVRLPSLMKSDHSEGFHTSSVEVGKIPVVLPKAFPSGSNSELRSGVSSLTSPHPSQASHNYYPIQADQGSSRVFWG